MATIITLITLEILIKIKWDKTFTKTNFTTILKTTVEWEEIKISIMEVETWGVDVETLEEV